MRSSFALEEFLTVFLEEPQLNKTSDKLINRKYCPSEFSLVIIVHQKYREHDYIRRVKQEGY